MRMWGLPRFIGYQLPNNITERTVFNDLIKPIIFIDLEALNYDGKGRHNIKPREEPSESR